MACAALVRHGYSYVGKVHYTVLCSVVQCSLRLLSGFSLFSFSFSLLPSHYPPFLIFHLPHQHLPHSTSLFLISSFLLIRDHHPPHLVSIKNINSFHCRLHSLTVSDVNVFTVGYLHFRYIRWAPADVHLLRAGVLPEAQAHGHGQNARES